MFVTPPAAAEEEGVITGIAVKWSGFIHGNGEVEGDMTLKTDNGVLAKISIDNHTTALLGEEFPEDPIGHRFTVGCYDSSNKCQATTLETLN